MRISDWSSDVCSSDLNDLRKRLASPTVEISGSVLHSGTPTSGFRNMLRPEITQHSARDSFEQAGLGPQDVAVVELHDAFWIAELVCYEALWLREDGESDTFLTSGHSTFGGAVVIPPRARKNVE